MQEEIEQIAAEMGFGIEEETTEPEIDKAEITAFVDTQIDQSNGYYSTIRNEQDMANEFYFLRQTGVLSIPEVDGRSGFVSSDVADLVEWMLPSLMEMFAAGNDAISLSPQSSEDVETAEQWTKYINYIFYRKNNGFKILYTLIKNVLLEKNGNARVDWVENTDIVTERFEGVDENQLTMLSEQGEIVEATQREDGLYDVSLNVQRSKGGVVVQNCPNNEIIVSPSAILGEKPSFIAQVTTKTISALRTEGWDIGDDIGSGDYDKDEMHYGAPAWDWDDENPDPSMREIRFVDAYTYFDLNGDGVAEYCRFVIAGDELLYADEVHDHPIITATGILVPHEWYGIAPADQAMDFQKLNTDVMRAFIDNLQMQVNGRMGVIEGQANIDDLLTVRPAGVIRMLSQGAVFPIAQPNVLNDAISAVSVFDSQKENRTGWTKYSQGTDSNSLNKTATGINIITNRGDMRLKLIARVIAETGVVDLFRKIMDCASRNASKPEIYQLDGEVVEFDPRQATTNFDFVINVGLGSGNKDQRIGHLTNMIQMQEKAMQIGVATPENVYNAMAELASETGFKAPEKFYTKPNQQQEGGEQLQQAEQAIEQLKGMVQQTQEQAQQQIDALQQQLDNVSESEKTKQAAIQRDIEAQKTRQKELDLLMAQEKTRADTELFMRQAGLASLMPTGDIYGQG
jgi:hypothetical protein